MNRQKMTDNMKQHSLGQTEAQTANVGIASSGAGRIKPSFSSYYLTLSKSHAAVPADEYKIPYHRQYLAVVRHAIKQSNNLKNG